MELDQYVVQVQEQLLAAAALGDDAARATAATLGAAAVPAVRLAVLGAVSAAADEITAALLDTPAPSMVTARLEGAELRLEVRPAAGDHGDAASGTDSAGAGGGTEEAEHTARISLRLPESLKEQAEAAARAAGVSLNTWLVRAVSAATSGPASHGWKSWSTPTSQRVSGWVNG